MMICPQCKKGNNDQAKFCGRCGAKLEQEQWIQQTTEKSAEKSNVCSKCGKPLKPGTKFCGFCGSKIEEVENKQEKQHGIFPIILGILLLVVMLAAAVLFFVPKIKEAEQEVTAGQQKDKDSKNKKEKDKDEANSEAEEEVLEEGESEEEILEKAFEELSEQIEKAKAAFEEENYVGEDGCRPILEAVMEDCVELTEEYDAEDDVLQEIVEDAFKLYQKAVFAEVDLLFHQDVRPELYKQMCSDLNAGLEQADKLDAAGLSVQKDELEEKKEELTESYYDRYITRFNMFTDLETWSRTESWDLMQDADSIGLVDHDDMDDPMTQRYAYALARVTMKNVENGINDGSMSAADAAAEIEAVMADTDYNLFLMNALSDYLYAAGDTDRGDDVFQWFFEIYNKICDTQGIDIESDIGWDYFWSFNEFEEKYSVSDWNGLTKENHEWIREYMNDKL